MGATPIAYVDETGIHKPEFQEELEYFTAQFQLIFGADIYIGNDTQDGQLLGLLALALDDVNNAAIQAYNSFSPVTAQGTGLASVVRINGIARKVPSFSTVPVTVIGQSGVEIEDGFVTDSAGNQWNLPASVTIPAAGQITVTATCSVLGAITTDAGDATIGTPSFGWQSATFLAAATPGAPVESDAALRVRQALSTSLPTKSILDGIVGAILALDGVNEAVAYENDSALPDDKGLPAHTIALVIDGGDATDIASTIAIKKNPGCGTYGSIITPIADSYGIVKNIAYFPPRKINIAIDIEVKPLAGFTLDIKDSIKSALVTWVNDLPIGAALLLPRMYFPAQLHGAADSKTYELVSIEIARDGFTPTAAAIQLAFDERPFTKTDFINITES